MNDKNLDILTAKKVERTVAALRANNFDAHYIQSKEQLLEKLDQIMQEGDSCSVGGSVTLAQLGIYDYLKSGRYNYLDRYADGADAGQVMHGALNCDVYLSSSNAITQDGKLYNVDGRGNRVAAMVYGPKKVIIIAGANKIVADITAAKARVREVSAPTNAIKLQRETPCAKTGKCSDCSSPQRICSYELVCEFQMVKDRIAVLILCDQLGY